MSVSAFVRYLNANLPPRLISEALLRWSREGGPSRPRVRRTKLNGVEIGRDLFDRKKWSRSKPWTITGHSWAGRSPRWRAETLEFVLADGFGKDFLAKLKATGKSVKELLKAAGKGTRRQGHQRWDKKIADLKPRGEARHLAELPAASRRWRRPARPGGRGVSSRCCVNHGRMAC